MKTLKYLYLFTILCFFSCIIFVHSNYKFNSSTSLPRGLYKLEAIAEPQKGDIVYFCADDLVSKQIVKRYLSMGKCKNLLAPIGKQIVASKGDLVLINKQGIYVNKVYVKDTRPLNFDITGHKLPELYLNKVLEDGEFIVASQKRNSFDSRYFGIVRAEKIEGRLKPAFILEI